jgi:hypothetical protein
VSIQFGAAASGVVRQLAILDLEETLLYEISSIVARWCKTGQCCRPREAAKLLSFVKTCGTMQNLKSQICNLKFEISNLRFQI